jgi:hypothetical protein
MNTEIQDVCVEKMRFLKLLTSATANLLRPLLRFTVRIDNESNFGSQSIYFVSSVIGSEFCYMSQNLDEQISPHSDQMSQRVSNPLANTTPASNQSYASNLADRCFFTRVIPLVFILQLCS